jgi:cephalosporin hydroxylase
MPTATEIVRDFHTLYYGSDVWRNTFWQSTPVLKCPLDLWMYQEIMALVRPDLIIECGTWAGGSSLFMAHMLDILGQGRIITIDILSDAQVEAHYAAYLQTQSFPITVRPKHHRIKQLVGSSTSPNIVAEVRAAAQDQSVVLIVADSDHSFEHTLAELDSYSSLVTPGSYFIMEDTNIPTHGPRQAVETFLSRHPEFHVAREMEKFHLTFNPSGYLLRRPGTTFCYR